MPTTILVGILPEWAIDYRGPKFHGCFCDPPYGLGFMGKAWDHGVPGVPYWKAISDILYPGAHLLAFGGTRTFHRLACAIEDAGFEIRDTLMWVYGSGFPKSLDVSKAIDRGNGVEREDKFEGSFERHAGPTGNRRCEKCGKWLVSGSPCQCPRPQDDAVSDGGKQWDGYGTALKPAWEPIILARKPIEGTVASNVRKYGCGALDIDGCRVGNDATLRNSNAGTNGDGWGMGKKTHVNGSTKGRWPANLIHDGDQAVMALFPHTASGLLQGRFKGGGPNCYGKYGIAEKDFRANSGSAARFFYCAKASKSERGEGNKHPTVKPIALCEYLARLILPPIEDSRLFVPFAGSGSECIGAQQAGWSEIVGVEREQEYAEIARARLCR